MTTKGSAGGKRRTTMVDVARAAGVSQSTVSFVVNNRRDVNVAETTRQRVLQAAGELNFRPNRTAQSLKLNQSFLVGIITNGIVAGPYAGRILAGIQKSVHADGQLCVVVDATGEAADGEAAVANFLAQGITSIIYASFVPAAIHASPLPSGARSVFVNCWPTDGDLAETIILADEYGGGYAAAAAAFDAGHTQVMFLGGTQGEHACVQRHRGFLDAATQAGLNPAGLLQTFGNYEISSGYDGTLAAFRHDRPTALICGNDRMAVGALLALHRLGLEVPNDVSIVGFDDQPDMANEVRPPLTTIALPYFEMGQEAGRLLFNEPAGLDDQIRVPCPLIERGSLGPPPALHRLSPTRAEGLPDGGLGSVRL